MIQAARRQQVDLTKLAWVVGACVLATIAAAAGLSAKLNGDYANGLCANHGCDDPAPALRALATGDVGGFFRYQSAIGLTSLALRAPVVAIAHANGGGYREEWQAGAAICLAVASLLVTWVAWIAAKRGVRLPVVLAGLALWMVAILWARGLFFGHPEESLAAALALAALATAATGRPVLAGVLLGLAIGTKEWALLVAPAVAAAGLPRDWKRVAIACLAAVLVTIGTMAAANPTAFGEAHGGRSAGDQHPVTPANIWFRTGKRHAGAQIGDPVRPPKLIGRWCRPFVIAFALVASLLFWRRRGWDLAAAMALAAFVLVARVLFDTQTFSYHLIPMLVLVTAWEVIGKRRFPIVGLLTMVAFQLTARVVSTSHDFSLDAFNAIFLAWTLPLFVLLGVAAFRRQPVSAAAPA